MALLRLQPEQISRHWPLIRWAVQVSMPPTTKETDQFFVKTLMALLAGRMQCWICIDSVTSSKLKSMVITELITNPLSGEKCLILSSGASFEPVELKDWRKGFLSLVKFAKANRCSSIAAYTVNKDLLDMFKRLGMSTEYTYVVTDI